MNVADAVRPGRGSEPVMVRTVAVDDRRARRFDAREDFGLGQRDVVDGVEVSEMAFRDRGYDGDVGPDHRDERDDFARVVHADLEYRKAGVLPESRQAQRHAPVIVE